MIGPIDIEIRVTNVDLKALERLAAFVDQMKNDATADNDRAERPSA